MRHNIYHLVFIGLCAIYPFLFFFFNASDFGIAPLNIQVLQPDTPSYYNFAPMRTLIYPVFLYGIHLIFDFYEAVVYPQSVFYAFACWYLAKIIFTYYSRRFLAFLTLLVILFNPVAYGYHFAVLTESFFFSFTVLTIALIIKIIHNPNSLSSWLWLGLVIGIATATRPVGLAFLPIVFVIWIFLKKTNWALARSVFLSCIAALFIIGAERIAHDMVHSDRGIRLLDKHLSAKAFSILAEVNEHPFANNAKWAQSSEVIIKDLQPFNIWKENWVEGCATNLASEEEIFLQYRYDFIRVAYEEQLDFAKTILKAYPIDYLKQTMCHVISSWSIFAKRHPYLASNRNHMAEKMLQFAHHENSSLVNIIPSFETDAPQSQFAVVINTSFFAVGIFMVILILLAPFLLIFSHTIVNHPHFKVAAVLAFLINGYILFIALFGISSLRYTVALVPAISLIFLNLTVWGLEFLKQRSDVK